VAAPAKPEPVVQDQLVVVLLPADDGSSPGRVIVSTPQGTAELSNAGDSTHVVTNGPPSQVQTMSESEIRRLFGTALDTLPAAPTHFTLYFRAQSDELTDESKMLVPDILSAFKGRAVAEVTVVGHTDTTGGPATNVALGLKRANRVRNLLVEAGLDGSSVEATSHGEADPLVPTPDQTAEPRNRRVEISVR
jgi:outer membrane protein OmpA-like peptidoglycan-associated protein